MKPRSRLPRRSGVAASSLALLLLSQAASTPSGAAAADSGPAGTVSAAAGAVARLAAGAATTSEFCAVVLRRLTGTSQPIRNTVHTGYESFVDSKPQIEPLETQQYLQYEDAAKTRPTLLMCKGKSADHLVHAYGPDAAQLDLTSSCRDVNREVVIGVWSGLTAAERAAVRADPRQIMLDADDVKLTGFRWITPLQFAYAGDDGRPHLVARRLRADWTDWRWKIAPDSVRGTYYCQFASPEYVRRLMLGETSPAPRAASD